jgi:hypothetical protein
MTLVSNDPGWWPTINSNRVASYFMGTWRLAQMIYLDLTLAAVPQLPAVLEYCMISVSNIVFKNL